MSISQSLLPEWDHEMANTRKVLERIPEDKLGWKAHEKSNTIGWVAKHLADLPSWATATLASESLDIAPPGGEPFKLPEAKTKRPCSTSSTRTSLTPERQSAPPPMPTS